MGYDISFPKKPILDILIAVAEKGGVENCINLIGRYLVSKNIKVRVVQLVYEGYSWTDESLEFYSVFGSRKGNTVNRFVEGYKNKLKEIGAPDLVIATAWPMMSYVAKVVAGEIGADYLVASWLHAPVSRYEIGGFGGKKYVDAADFHFAISDAIANELYTSGDTKIYRVNNPVDLSRVKETYSHKKGELLYVGRLSAEKNIQFILRAIKKTKTPWNLTLVGEGAERESLEGIARELEILDRTNFVGWSEDPWKYAEGKYALVMSSLYEGFPLVAIEALSCGLPVIANEASGVGDIITNGQNGFIYKNNDIEGLAELLDEIYIDKDLADLSEECKKTVANYAYDRAAYDFYVKAFAAINKRLITNKLYGCSDNYIIDEQETLMKNEDNSMADEAKEKLISVVIPFTCENNDLERSVNSILAQKNFNGAYEIIIVDGCAGRADALLKCIEAKMPEAILIVLPENDLAKKELLNLGIEYCSGEYVLFLNAGDELNRNLFSCMWEMSERYDPDLISFGVTKALSSFAFFEIEPFDLYSFSSYEFETPSQRKAFLNGDTTDTRYLCYAYNTEFLNKVGQRFTEEAGDDDITFAYPLLFLADRIVVTKDHGYCSFADYTREEDSNNAQKTIAGRFNLQLQLLEQMQSLSEIYKEYQDIIEAHFFHEYFLKSLDIIEASGKKDALSDEIFQIMKLVTLRIIPRWNENDYICDFDKESIERIKTLSDTDLSAADLCEEFQNKGKVSVIIATYNRCEYIAKAIECILSQTWKNLELIIIDDGSDDRTEDIVRSFCDERIVYVKNENNKGISYSRNKGVETASGRYIVFQDDDDYCRLDKIEKQVLFMEKQMPNVGMAYCVTANHRYALDGNLDDPPILIPAGKEKAYVGCDGFVYPKLLPKNFIACTAMIIRKECFDTVGMFDESLFAYEDWDITLRITKNYEVGIIKEVLYDYYRRDDGLTANDDTEHRKKIINSLHDIDIKYKQDMKKYGIESKFVLG